MVNTMNREKETLYIKDNKKKIRCWSIEVEDNLIIITHGEMGGTMQVKTEVVPYGKGGRNRAEQIVSRVESRIHDQMKKGYVYSLKEAEVSIGAVNLLKLPKPMLAKKFNDVPNVDLETSFIQRKYNGHRCLITKQNGKVFAYSRQGLIIPAVEHITDEIAVHIDDGEIIDGELYHHGTKLQTISSWIKRKQPETRNLSYIMYDCIMNEPYKARLDRLCQIQTFDNLFVAPTKYAYEGFSVKSELEQYLAEGYEGVMIRQGNHVYEAGKRSGSLIKLKKILGGVGHEEDFEVIDIHESIDGWAILECRMQDGQTFRVTAPGTMEDKYEVANNPEMYIGQFVNVEYFDTTASGKPFHAVAIRFVDYL